MKKIPTIFVRDWNGDRSRVLNESNPDCGWVFAGEGRATRKLDGTCCMVRNGLLYKRREIKPGGKEPADFELSGHDEETGKTVGWVPVCDGPDDRYHREAFSQCDDWADGTYELIGPKVQGNPEGALTSVLVRHGYGLADSLKDAPRDFDGLAKWFAGRNIEGIVWHHPDGRMAKIKARDFSLKRKPSVEDAS